MTPREVFERLIVGMTGSIGAVGITLTELEQYLRLTGAAVGIVVGVLSAISIYKGIKKK